MAKSIESESYRIRVSSRAKHVSIKVSHLGEVEVVIPKGFDRRRVPAILKKRQDWIAKTTGRIEAERQRFQTEPVAGLPEQIILRSLPEEWAIAYRPTPEPQIKAIPTASSELTIRGQIDPENSKRILQRWLSRKAQLHFEPWLWQVSQEVVLPFHTVSIRGQKTRWASCSSEKNISLNYKLLFLPAPLVRYVFIHELCHTIHLNHSSKFWALVAEKEPDYKSLDKELRKAWRYVPGWIEQSSA